MPIFPIHDGRELTHVARPYATWAIILGGVGAVAQMVLVTSVVNAAFADMYRTRNRRDAGGQTIARS